MTTNMWVEQVKKPKYSYNCHGQKLKKKSFFCSRNGSTTS